MSVSQSIAVLGSPVDEATDIPFTSGMNVQQAMELAYDASPGSVRQFSLKYFGATLKYELVTLDSITTQVGGDTATFLFWELSINGVVSPSGLDGTVLQDGDAIGWNYTFYDSGNHDGTRYEDLRSAIIAHTKS